MWAWGWNAYGQLGDGTTIDRHVPTLIRNRFGFTSVSGGGLHSLGRMADGTVWARGWNGVGQLGDGSTTDHHRPGQDRGLRRDGDRCRGDVPVPVGTLPPAAAVGAGAFHTLAR